MLRGKAVGLGDLLGLSQSQTASSTAEGGGDQEQGLYSVTVTTGETEVDFILRRVGELQSIDITD